MAALPKAIIKKYGMTKKAWAVFRKQKGAGAESAPKRKRRKRAAKSSTKSRTASGSQQGEKKMAKKRKSFRGRARRAARRVGVAMETRPGKVVTMAVTAAAGGVASSFVVNKTPILKDQGRGTKSLIQGAVGLAAIMFIRNRHVKSLGAGAVIAAAMGAAKEFLRVEPLAGPSAGGNTLTPSEMRALTNGQMGIPLPGTMNAPLGAAPAGSGFTRGGFGS